jgi:hypothetical protein
MATIIELDGVAPTVGEDVFLASTAGVPAAEKKQLSGSALEWTRKAAQEYQRYRERYLTASRIRASE